MKTPYLFLLLIILSSITSGLAQNKNKIKISIAEDNDPTPIHYKWLGTDSRIITKMGLTYQKPEGFKEEKISECFEGYPLLKSAFSCLSNQLQSDDGQFIAFMPIWPLFSSKDSLLFVSYHKQRNPKDDVTNMHHIYSTRAVLKRYYIKEINVKDVFQYYPDSIAKNQFNADTVIRFTIKLRPEDAYKKDFKYIDTLILQKNGKQYINFYCFYTDKAKKNLDFYWKKIEGVLRYEK